MFPPARVAELDVADRRNDFREEGPGVRVLGLLEQLGVAVAQRRRAHVAQADGAYTVTYCYSLL